MGWNGQGESGSENYFSGASKVMFVERRVRFRRRRKKKKQAKLSRAGIPMSDDEDEAPTPKRGTDDDYDSANLPAFINKILQMLADPDCLGVFQYGSEGNTILVVDNTQFSSVSFLFCSIFNRL